MEPSKQNPNMRIYFGRSFKDLLDAGVRAPIHDDQALWAADGHRNLMKF
jgi:hypothetical protein